MLNVIRCIDAKVCIQEFSYFVSGLDIQLEKSEYDSPVRKKISCRWRNTTSHIPVFSSYRYESKAEWLRLVADMGSIPDVCWNDLQLLGHFAWHWARQCTDTRAFYIAALSIIFFLGFRQWRSRADRVVNLNTTIRLPLFWRTWTRAQASTPSRPHVLAWHMGRDYSNCRASELTDLQVSGFVFSWFLKNTEKTRASSETFLRLTPQTGWGLTLPRKPPPTPLLYSAVSHPLQGYVRTQKKTQTKPQNTRFPGLNLKLGKVNYRLGNLDPYWPNVWKVDKTNSKNRIMFLKFKRLNSKIV